MRIFIATGIYPPEVGGPAQYAFNLEKIWNKSGHEVRLGVFSKWNFLPTGIRHLAYMFSIVPKILNADFVLILDTFSSALPTVFLGKLFGKKMVLRTGGDFLWEQYVERTGEMILLKNFYEEKISNFSKKEKDIFRMTKYVLKNVGAVVWSTKWQKDIFLSPYKLEKQNSFIIENYYGERVASSKPKEKNFIAYTRDLKWKNIDLLKKVFSRSDVIASGAVLNTSSWKHLHHHDFIDAVKNAYSVIIASLGDVSPNTILDAVKYQKPFILTEENGLKNRLDPVAIYVNPKDEEDIAKKVIWLCDESNYYIQKTKLESFTFVHSWEKIAEEFLEVYKKIK